MIKRMLEVPFVNPDDYRRGRLLNILLIGMAALGALLLLVSVAYVIISQAGFAGEIGVAIISILIFIFVSIGIYILNRIRSGNLASWLFLFILIFAISFADTPRELVDGRSIYLFTLPILIASFILFPSASFIFAGICSLTILALTIFADIGIPNFFGMVGFVAIGLVAWLAANSMENALREIRILNVELDKRVEERTRELAEALERESAESSKNQAILEGIADGVIVLDAHNKLIIANPSVCNLLEVPRSELIGKNLEEFINSSNLPDAEKGKFHILLTRPDKDAPSVRFSWGNTTLSITTASILTPVGTPIGTAAVFRDFTREAEVEKMKNTFVAMVSHELRTPLNAILAYSEMIVSQVYGPTSPKLGNAAERIFSNSQRLISLVSDLLDQASLEAGKIKVKIEEVAVAQAMDAMRGVMEKPSRDKGLGLIIEIEPNVPATVWGDSHRLQQILINLVNNAVKFTEKGEVTVRAYRPDEQHWALDVKDTGPGIPAEALPYIFEPFRQVAGVTTRQHGGVGLGLSIVKRLVELMGGSISVSSTVGEGSTFTALLPIHPANHNKGGEA
jgi:PAS domain S-box-containing protein